MENLRNLGFNIPIEDLNDVEVINVDSTNELKEMNPGDRVGFTFREI